MIRQDIVVHPLHLNFPHLPSALGGVRIVHLTDLHVRRLGHRHRRTLALLRNMRFDLVVLTGDYITREGDEDAGTAAMEQVCQVLRPRLGTYGVFGNHDTVEIRRRLNALPIRWLCNESDVHEEVPLRITGVDANPVGVCDVVASLLDRPATEKVRPFRLLLSHFPTYLPVAADLGVDIMFTGHTHGGQCRLPGGRALVNSTDWPLELTSGILRHRDTIAVVSRGIGEVKLPRIFCPPQIPIYTLHQGPMRARYCDNIRNVEPW